MRLKHRKIRLGLVLGMAVVVAFVAWRSEQRAPAGQAETHCVPGRHEEKDASGAVIRVTRTYCR